MYNKKLSRPYQSRAVTNVGWRQSVKSSILEGQMTEAAFPIAHPNPNVISNLISLRRWLCSLPSFFAAKGLGRNFCMFWSSRLDGPLFLTNTTTQ